jgi:DNA-directed RNA polymerase subunit RPC12/RpoP
VEINGKLYREIRCPNCKHMIGYDHDLLGTFGYNCPKCGIFSSITFKQLKTASNQARIALYMIEKLRGGE